MLRENWVVELRSGSSFSYCEFQVESTIAEGGLLLQDTTEPAQKRHVLKVAAGMPSSGKMRTTETTETSVAGRDRHEIEEIEQSFATHITAQYRDSHRLLFFSNKLQQTLSTADSSGTDCRDQSSTERQRLIRVTRSLPIGLYVLSPSL